jgi:hypothetical protein
MLSCLLTLLGSFSTLHLSLLNITEYLLRFKLQALLQKLVDYCYLDGVAEVTSQVIRANMNENTQRRRLLDALRTKGLIRALLQRCADRGMCG